MTEKINPQDLYKMALDKFPGLLTSDVDIDGEITGLYFKNKQITTKKLCHHINCNSEIVVFCPEQGSFSLQLDFKLEKNRGFFSMAPDLELCKEACWDLIDHNITIEYADKGGYVSYDIESIERLRVLGNIIKP